MVASQKGSWAWEGSGRIRVKVRAAILSEGKLVVVPERRVGSHSHLALPGGRIDRDATIEDALAREVNEETGVGHPLMLPPIVREIRSDPATHWQDTPRWLGNVWDGALDDGVS